MHPVLIEIGGQPIYSYGVMLGGSLVLAWYIVMRIGPDEPGLTRDVRGTTFVSTAIVAILSSRVLYLLTNPAELADPSRWLDFQSGGLVAYGGFLGGLLGAWLVVRRHPDTSLIAWADITAPGVALGLGLVRIGCYLYGCDYGLPLEEDAPAWLRTAGTFPQWANHQGSPAWAHHVAAYDLPPLADHSLPVHPTQLYESACGFVLAGVAFWQWRRRRFPGQVILSVAVLYGVWRFLIEYVRDDPERGFYFGFSTSQLISLALVPTLALMYQVRHKHAGKPVPAAASVKPSDAPDESKAPVGKIRKRRVKRRR